MSFELFRVTCREIVAELDMLPARKDHCSDFPSQNLHKWDQSLGAHARGTPQTRMLKTDLFWPRKTQRLSDKLMPASGIMTMPRGNFSSSNVEKKLLYCLNSIPPSFEWKFLISQKHKETLPFPKVVAESHKTLMKSNWVEENKRAKRSLGKKKRNAFFLPQPSQANSLFFPYCLWNNLQASP